MLSVVKNVDHAGETFLEHEILSLLEIKIHKYVNSAGPILTQEYLEFILNL